MSSSLCRTIIQHLVKRNTSVVAASTQVQFRLYHQLVNSNNPIPTQNNASCLASNSSRFCNEFSKVRAFSDKTTDEVKEEAEDVEEKEESSSEDEQEVSEVEKLQEELKEMKDQFLRSLAEQENIRRIAKRDVENARNYAVGSFAKSLLDTSDNLSRAMEAVPEEFRTDNDSHPVLSTLFQGIQMTDDGLTKAFIKNGLKKFGTPGDKFDPNMHEALFEYPDENSDAGSVGQVMKCGFLLNDRVIRPAEVGITKKA